MTIDAIAPPDIRSRHRIWLLTALVMIVSFAVGVVQGSTAYAATDEPDAGYVYRLLELAKPNEFRVYAKPGETIHFTIYDGDRRGEGANTPNANLCSNISIRDSGGNLLNNANVDGTRHDGSTWSATGVVAQRSTCSTGGANDNLPMKTITIHYTVPAGVNIASMNDAYVVRFEDTTRDGDKVQGYEWRIAVSTSTTDPLNGRRPGRVWFVGDDSGLKTWQDNVEAALTTHSTNHVFKFVREDGFRYTVRYNNYQGIWSEFHGGVYGVRVNTTPTKPAYRSYAFHNGSTNGDFVYSGINNLAYIFVDCTWGDDTCPADVPVERSQPITSDNGGTGNPIAAPDSSLSAPDTAFRYTGYDPSANLAGGTVDIPFSGMQTGSIRLIIKREDGTLLCQKDFLVDSPTGTGTKYFTVKQDSSCTAGTLKTSAAPLIPPTERLSITAQALRLGEMHFIEVDTEQRGGIEVKGNGKVLAGTDSNRWVAWYDPFSRLNADTCGLIPPRIGPGAPGSALSSGALSDDLTWDSMSSNIGVDPVTGASTVIPRRTALTAGAAESSRVAVSSSVSGGVHGWISGGGCDGTGTGSTDGYSNWDGTASSESTWGNDRVIDDWTYAYSDPVPFTVSVGGPTYGLTPTVNVAPSSQVVPAQNPMFSYSVANSAASSNTTTWSIRSIIVPPGVTLPSDYRNGFDGTGRTCASYYAAPPRGAVTCNDALASGSGNFPGTSIADETVPNTYPVGTLICRSLTVDSYNQLSAPNARTSALTCVMVTALPYVSVIGGTIWSGGSTDAATGYVNNQGKIEGSSTITAGFGSLGEYDLFATNSINYFGSAGRPGPVLTTSGVADGTGLTFGSASSLGVFSSSHKITDLVAKLCAGVLANNTANFAGVNDEVIRVGEHPIKCLTTLNIKKNIMYDPTGATSFGQLPSLIVVANRIEIDGSVKEIAGNFYAAEAFITCAEGPRNLTDNSNSGKTSRITTTGSCTTNGQLVINGSITVAKQRVAGADNPLVLNRTYGGTKIGEPAEVIRMRPEVFLTPYENSLLLTTVNETELPARY